MNPFKKNTFSDNEPTGEIISFIGSDFIEGNTDIDESLLQETLPILPLRNTIVFPGSTIPISVGRKKSIDLVKSLGGKQRYIGLVCQKDIDVEDPGREDLYRIGVIAEVIRVIELGDNNYSIIVQAKQRFEWLEITQVSPFLPLPTKSAKSIPAPKDDKEFNAILDSIRDAMLHMFHLLGDPPKELLSTLRSEAFSSMLISYCGTNLPIESRETGAAEHR